MKAYVLGIGRMGTAIAYAMDKFGFDVVGMDTNPNAAQNIPDNHFIKVDDAEGICKTLNDLEKPDVVISSLPYHQTEIVGKWCVDNAVRYCDLGGRVDVSENINAYAEQKATKPVFTDLGLAPGWVNILAEQGCKEVHGQADEVRMMVGGLPEYHQSINNPLRYAVSWSVDGLINEYRDDCLILEDGEIKTVRGMDGVEQIEGDNFGRMEAFYTSGGASHSIHSMKERGVKNCYYKTIRYRGHGDLVRFLIRDCGLDDDTLTRIFLSCGPAIKDEVFVVAEVKSGDKKWRKEKVVKSDDNFSAMQKSTAFSISSVAKIMAEGKLEGDKEQHRDYHTKYPKNLGYKDVPFEEFNNNLEHLLTSKY